MIRKLMITAVLGLAFSGFAFAQEPVNTPPVNDDNAMMYCKFGDLGKKDAAECQAIAVFEKTMPEFHHPIIGDLKEGFKVACDGDIKYVGKVEYGIHPDFDDIIPYKVDSFFKGTLIGSPIIHVNDLNWAHLRGEYRASLTLMYGPPVTIPGVCKFKRAHDQDPE
jgi:hypothetical protein